MPGKPIKPKVLAELNRQLNHELSASHNYLALAVWCEDQNFKGFARYFKKQAGEEQEHAERFIKHLLDRSVVADLGQISAPRRDFQSLLDVAQHARSMEQSNTAGINAAYESAMSERDYPAQVLLDWFINEQVEEEAWADEMVERVQQASCAGGISDLDRHLERYLNDDVIGEEAKE